MLICMNECMYGMYADVQEWLQIRKCQVCDSIEKRSIMTFYDFAML